MISEKRGIWWNRCCGPFVLGCIDGKIRKCKLGFRRGNWWANNMIQRVGLIKEIAGPDYVIIVVYLSMLDLI